MTKDDDRTPTGPEHDKRRKLPDRDTLYQLHVVEGLSAAAIARRYQVTPRAAWLALKRTGVFQGQHKRPVTPEDLATLQRLFDAGLPQTEIAATVGRTPGFVSGVIRRHGWTRRNLRRGRKAKPKGGITG